MTQHYKRLTCPREKSFLHDFETRLLNVKYTSRLLAFKTQRHKTSAGRRSD